MPIDKLANLKKLELLNLKLQPVILKNAEWANTAEGNLNAKNAAGIVSNIITEKANLKAVTNDSAQSFASILKQHPAFEFGKKWIASAEIPYLDQFKKADSADNNLTLESASLLVSGLFALASLKIDISKYCEPLLMIALGGDKVNLQLRKQITDLIPGWKPVLPPLDKIPKFIIPGGNLECVGALRQGLLAAGNWFSNTNPTQPPDVDVSSIVELQPNTGGCGTEITIIGSFAKTKPERAFVAFPNQNGKPILVPIDDNQWGTSKIYTAAPDKVGDGAVAIVTLYGEPSQGNPIEALQFAEVLDSCFGRGAHGIAGKVSKLIWSSMEVEIPNIPPNIGNTNLFHGGPIFKRVISPEIHDTDHLFVEGLNIADGDKISVDGILYNTVVTGNQLEATNIDGIGMRGGIREVKIFRGSCSSLSGSVRLLPRVDSLRTPRGTPGSVVIFDGACFSENDITAAVNRIHANVRLENSGNGRSICVTIPYNLKPLKPDPDGEEYEITLYDRGVQLGINTFKVIVETYRIVALGDSVMWGQGLLENQKFTELVGQRVISNGRNVYRQDRSANSGAKIMNNVGEADYNCGASPSVFDVSPSGSPVNFQGEKNCGASSVANQVSEWAKIPLEIRNRVDLVLIDGGINDFGVMTILSPFTFESEVYNGAAIFCSQMGFKILAKSGANSALVTFPNATIVITGYYPIVTINSDLLMITRLINYITLGFLSLSILPLAGSLLLKDSLVKKSKIFADRANEVLKGIVRAVNDPRVKFAVPDWNDDNGVFAPNSLLFGLISAGLTATPEDPVAISRIPLCSTPCLNVPGTPPTASTCAIASLGHPNAKGALAYADAIMKVL